MLGLVIDGGDIAVKTEAQFAVIGLADGSSDKEFITPDNRAG